MRIFLLLSICCFFCAPLAAAQEESSWTFEQVWAQALVRNQSIFAAKLFVEEAEIERTAARLWPNPELSYNIGNLVVGTGNDQERDLHPTFFEQTIQQVAISQALDIWGARRAQASAWDQGIVQARLRIEDALRMVRHTVASAYVDVIREQTERAFARDIHARYMQTVELTRKRFDAGDVAESELRAIELEGMRYANAEIDAEAELRVARQNLAALLAYDSECALPQIFAELPKEHVFSLQKSNAQELVEQALEHRPDYLAIAAALRRAELDVVAAKRRAFPEPSLEFGYTRSYFQISGDNPHALHFGLALPLPVLNRNQAEKAQTKLQIRQTQIETQQMRIQIAQEVAQAKVNLERVQQLLEAFEAGGMQQRAATALRVAEKSYQAGASSFLEMLEAERMFLQIQQEYLATRYAFWQANIDIMNALALEF